MYVTTAELTFSIPYSNSLKDKRKIRSSLIEKAKHKFNASIAEVATQDDINTLTIGIAVVSSEASFSKNSINEIIRFMETNTDADLISIELDT